MKTRTKIIGGSIGSAIVLLLFFVMVLTYNCMKADAPPPNEEADVPAPPPPPPDRLSAIDRLLEGLEIGNIAFNAPRSMNFHDTAIIQLMLGLATPVDELKRMIEAEGEKEGTSIRVSDRMEARLSGPNFAITAITPEIQAVSRSDVTE